MGLAQYVAGDALKFTVYDSDPLKGDDVLGTVTMTSENFYPQGLAGEVLLDNAGKNVEAFLMINIEASAAAMAPPATSFTNQMPMQTMQMPMEPVAGGYQVQQQGYQVVQQGQSMFDMIDRNHDGVIS